MPNTTSKRGIRTGCRFEPPLPPPNPHTLHPQFPPRTNEQALIIQCRSHHNVTAQSYSSTWASIRELAVLCHCHRRAAVKASHSCTVIKVVRIILLHLHLAGRIDSYMAGVLILSGTQLFYARAHSRANVRTHSHTITRILIFFGAQLYYTQLARACAHALAQHNE